MPHHDPLLEDFLSESAATVITSPTTVVPNIQPTINSVAYRMAIVGEAPGKDEIQQAKPFVGYSGQLLNNFLSRFSILRDACFIGNVCQHQPPANRIAEFDWDGPQITRGLAKLGDDLKTFRPNVVLLLGGSALHAFKEPPGSVKKRKGKDGLVFNFPNSITDWRGSFFLSHPQSPLPGVKCISALHPAACLRQYDWTPLLMLDIQRAMRQATTPELVFPYRNLRVGLPFEELLNELDKIIATRPSVGTDIEGYWNWLKCICFAPSPEYAFTVPFTTMSGGNVWSFDEEFDIWKRVVRILSCPHTKKIWQNGLYDRFVLQYGHNIVVRGPSSDIMLKHWEQLCELPKALAVQASIYTDEPYWKHERLQSEEGM